MIEARRRLKKIGGSVALFIPKEMLEDLRMGPDTEVEISSEGTSLRIQRAEQGPPDDLIEFAHRFTKKYDEALRNLAQR
jgi:antitoxin component of MazEF toxin-antitoxin module